MSFESKSYKEIKQYLRQEAAKAAMKNNVIPFRPDPTPCPGDTFALRELADLPVEVVIVERDPSDVRRLKVNLLDDYPQIGSTDVELALAEPGRVANIRCDLDTWLDVSRFPVETRTGMLPLESLAEIQKKRQAIEAGDVRPSLYEEEVDGDPEYRRWKDETLGGALSSLKTLSSLRTFSSLDVPQVNSRSSWTPYLARLAAAAVLVFGVFLGVRQMDQLREQMTQQSEKLADFEQSERELTEKLEASRRGLTETSEALSERDQQVTELEHRIEAMDPKAVEPNLPFAFLNYGTGSGPRGEHTIIVPKDAGRVALIYEVVDPEPYSHYGLRITDQRTGEEIWSHDEMLRDGSVVSLGLPASLLPSGDYVVVLSGYRKGKVTPLDESFLLHVRRPGER